MNALLDLYHEMEHYGFAAAAGTTHIGRAAVGGVDALVSRLEKEGSGELSAVRLPWRTLDRALGNGLAPGQVTVLAGAAGAAKSYLLLNLLHHAASQEKEWRLLPLEDDAGWWVQRMLAVSTGSWEMVARPSGDSGEERRLLAGRKLTVARANPNLMRYLYRCIYENPRLPIDNGTGSLVVPEVRYADVLAMVESIAGHVDLVGIDCLSQVDFSDNGADYLGQADFMRRLVGIAAATSSHIVLVGHLAKASGGKDPLDAIQGSAMFNRLAHNVLTLTRHDPAHESAVAGRTGTVHHRLTLSVLKCRTGMSGSRFAFDLDADGPVFTEYGAVLPRRREG